MKMRRFSANGGALAAALFAAMLLTLAGCSNPNESEIETPSLLSIRAETVKTDYIQGERLNLRAITVTGTYSGGNTRILSITDADIQGYEPENPGEQTLTVTAEGKSDSFTVKVTADPEEAREILAAAVDKALENMTGIALSADGKDVPLGVNWITPAQKAALDRAVDGALDLTEAGGADVEAMVAALEALQAAVDAAATAVETQAGTKTDWSYTVLFNANGGGADPQNKTVTSPDISVGSLPAAPARDGYAFNGWNTRANGSGSVFTGATPVTANITVYAQWIDVVNAQAPRIRSQPRSAGYMAGEAAAALSVTAESPDGGELSYQWYRSGSGGWTAISGATERLYTPPTTAGGAVVYYARITNTNDRVIGIRTASTNSNLATVTVTAVNASAPVISSQIQDAAYVVGEAAAALSVTAESPDGGVLSYQWHRAVTGSNGWTAIDGAAGSSYAPPTTAAGALSYYVRITNTNEGVSGISAAWVNSAVATVTVVAVDARAPDISAQPQGGTYALNEAAALSVTATSPDSGVLSYQWHRSTSSATGSDGWEPVSGATAASYTPPTAAYGTVSYYVRVANTNSGASGATTTAVNSAPAVVVVARVNAQAPVIQTQPQDAAYYPNGSATPLSVTAEVSDGGTLSYQWHSRGASAAGWTAITGATSASYPPSTASLGIVYYYVAITNTKTGLDGEPRTVTNSRVAKVDITTSGASGLQFTLWANDDGSLISNMPDDLVISRSAGQILTIAAPGDLSNLQWSVNNTDIAGPRGAAQSIAIEAAKYAAGKYTLGLRAEKGGIPYSINISFMVDN
jgi:uncharacterized repeat protein (TIGR02543 family)